MGNSAGEAIPPETYHNVEGDYTNDDDFGGETEVPAPAPAAATATAEQEAASLHYIYHLLV